MDNAIQYVVFADELELDATPVQKLTFYYFGIIVPIEKVGTLEHEVEKAIAILGKLKYHARKQYKREEYATMLRDINSIIITHQLKIVCFPFVKEWLNSPTLAVLKEVSYPEAPQVTSRNYRSQAWLLFIHVLNYYFEKNYPNQTKARVFVDHDWLKINQGIEHNGVKLEHLEAIIAGKTKDLPLLTLADHTAYLFLQLRRNKAQPEKLAKPQFDVQLNAAKELLANNGLFNLLDLPEWIDYENRPA